jgi:hypothetical protein
MTAARFARLVRFCDERYTTRADGLASAARHFEQSRFKSQSNDAEKRQSWPYRGLPLVAVGSHRARGLVMFGVCQSLKWAPNPDPSDAQMYPSVIEVAWERTVFEVDPESFPTRPGRSYVGLSRDQYDAWRRAAEPVAYADEIEYITAPDGAARAV